MNEEHDVLIVGAGFAGIGAAIRLARAGNRDFAILERADEIGGTWRDNAYPGAACDVPSHLYSFSFALNPNWRRAFPSQEEIWDYLRDCVERHGLQPHLRLGHEMLDARWDSDAARWQVRTNNGTFTGRVLVIGAGPLSEPKTPALPGLDSFAGTTFHSARWDHEHSLAGERIAVIGTGASAIQFVPKIQPEASKLHVFQRSAPWIFPRLDRRTFAPERWLYRRVPATQLLNRFRSYAFHESFAFGMTLWPPMLTPVEAMSRALMRRQVTDRSLHAALLPDYRMGCKRLLVSSDYYPTFNQPNTELVTSPIAAVGPHSITTDDGVEREIDTIIFATGFKATRPPITDLITGRDGIRLADVWAEGMKAYRGTTVAGFPNMFVIMGPNTGLGHTSVLYMIESQLNYLISALSTMDKYDAVAVDVDQAAQDAYNEALQRRMRPTVWMTGGCTSWYIDPHGENTTLWPSFTFRFRKLTREFDPRGYHLIPRDQQCPQPTP